MTETRSRGISSGADLPLGFSFNLTYSQTQTIRLQLVSGTYLTTDSRQREWPVGTVRFTRNLKKSPFSQISASMGFRHREGSTLQPSLNSNARTATVSTSLTPDMTIGFRNGMVVLLGYASNSQRSENNGNTTESDQDDLTGTLSYSFRLPRSVSRLQKQVSASLIAILAKGTTCLARPDDVGCTIISDTRRKELRGGLDTDVLKLMRAGLQFGYTLNDARHLNRRVSQIFIALTAQLSLYAGDYR